jgi:ABC-2 type transport system ATP-binding protein
MTNSIECSLLTKKFQTSQKQPGLAGAMKHFFQRTYQSKIAVNNFDMQIKQGEIVGLLGPNGAGKTTLMKMFTGIIVPSSGQLKVLGFNPSDRPLDLRLRMALVMGQKSQLWWDIPAMDSFHLLQKYYQIPPQNFRNRLEEMGTLLGVTDLFHVLIRKLSLGERMKMEVMASLLHNPEVIFLDEPTIGLDLVAQENIRHFILEYHKKYQPTLLITSHYMADVQALCRRLVLIFNGEKTFDGKISEFETLLGDEVNLTLEFEKIDEEIIVKTNHLLEKFDPQWSNQQHSLDIRVPKIQWRTIATDILLQLPLKGISTEKLPIERVMKTLMKNPEILKATQQKEKGISP